MVGAARCVQRCRSASPGVARNGANTAITIVSEGISVSPRPRDWPVRMAGWSCRYCQRIKLHRHYRMRPPGGSVSCVSVAAICPVCDGWAVETGMVTTGRMRVSIGLTVTGAVLLMVGVITMFVGEALRLKSPHGWHVIVRLGETVAACGLGCGLALFIVVASGRPARRRRSVQALPDGRSRPVTRPDPAARSDRVAGPDPAGRSGHAGRPRRSDRSRRPARPAYACEGGAGDASRPDSADEWLSPLRSSRPSHAPERDRWSGHQPIEEFTPALDHAEDGWYPDGVAAAGPAVRSWPAGQPAPWSGGSHRATGTLPPSPQEHPSCP